MSEEERNYYLKLFKTILDDLEECYKPETVRKVMQDQGMGTLMQLRLLLFAHCHRIEWIKDFPDIPLAGPDLN